MNWRGRHGPEHWRGSDRIGRHGPDRSARPSRVGVAGGARHGFARSGQASQAWRGSTQKGMAGRCRRGAARCCAIRPGFERRGRHGFIGMATAWKAWLEWRGSTGSEAQGLAGLAWHDDARLGPAWKGMAGKAWSRVEALARRCWLGEVGEAERGKARQARRGRARERRGRQRLVGTERGAWQAWQRVEGSGLAWLAGMAWSGMTRKARNGWPGRQGLEMYGVAGVA
jgi:hypothetical protein